MRRERCIFPGEFSLRDRFGPDARMIDLYLRCQELESRVERLREELVKVKKSIPKSGRVEGKK